MKKAQSGIGTLIIFIAMLLVAAVAAGVLIQTTSSLQNKALITGAQAKNQISTHLDVLSVTGANGTDSDVENVTMIVKLSPGSESIDASELVIIIDTPGTSENFRYGTGAGTFAVTYLQNGTEHQDGYIKMGDVAEIKFDLATSLQEGQMARFDLIPKIGIPTSTEVLMPDIVSQYRVHLYP